MTGFGDAAAAEKVAGASFPPRWMAAGTPFRQPGYDDVRSGFEVGVREGRAAAMMPPVDETHAPTLRSWVPGASDHPGFPIQNLPLGIFSAGDGPRGGIVTPAPTA